MQLFRRAGFVLIVWLCLSAAVYSDSGTSDDTYKLLFDLKPLPKVHYSWGLWSQFKDCEERVLYELARITHSLSIPGEWVTKEQIDKCVYICARVNKTEPEIPCSIGVNFSPWHRKFGKELPPTDRGPTYYAEIDFFSERMRKIKRWIADTNKKYKADVKVGALLLDCERFHKKPENKVWNEGFRQALDAIHIKAKAIFPGARIEWYGRGFGRSSGKWVNPYLFTGREIKAPLSCALYRVPEQNVTREAYVKTCGLADKLLIQDVTPWIALGSGYRQGLAKDYWADDWDYDLIYSYSLGEELNKSTSDSLYSRAKIVVFFPAPFARETPAWTKHFVTYVRGATGVEGLSDLGFNK